jgi:putative intracellular protease/amidase
MDPTSSAKPTLRVAVLLFAGADILDYAGPIEVLTHATHNHSPDAPQPIFSIQTVCRGGGGRDAAAPPVVSTGSGNLSVQPSISIAEMMEELDRFHVLVVPGGPLKVMQQVMGMEDGLEVGLIRAFGALGPAAGGVERILLSVCTGAFLLGAAGVLSGLKVTTHHRALEQLQALCDAPSADGLAAGAKTEVVGGKRFVDAGVVKDGLRIVTAGGVSSGLDAALHLVEMVKDRATADFICRVMDYERRQV